MKKFGKYTLLIPRKGKIASLDENNSENFVVFDNNSHIFKRSAYLDVIERHKRLLDEIKKESGG